MPLKDTFDVHARTRRAMLVVLMCLPTLLVPVSADDLCGTTIVANLKLEADLTCAASGLIVGADGIRINLNGHAITGPGTGVGISVIGRTAVTIFGGTVRNFDTGVRTMNSTAIVIKQTQFLDNVDGIDLQSGSSAMTIKENEFGNNRARGIMIRGASTRHVIQENTFTGNRVGILVFAGVDNTLKENIVSASGLAGIRVNVFATGNLILENTVTSNPVGIELIVTAAAMAAGNSVIENTVTANVCGVKGATAGNDVAENVFAGNGADYCP